MKYIRGNTYPVKEHLKRLGARWDSLGKCWKVPDDKEEEALRIVAEGPTAEMPAAAPATTRRAVAPAPPPPPPPPEVTVPVYDPPRACDHCANQGGCYPRRLPSGDLRIVCIRCEVLPLFM